MHPIHAITIAAGIGLSSTLASAQLLEYDFVINVEQTVPRADVGAATPSGTGLVTLDLATNELTWDVAYQGLTGDIVDPGAHFHGPADFGETAGVEVFFAGGPSGVPLPQPASGRLMGSTMLTADQARDVQAGLWYVNIHTALNPSGEIRGQVIPAPASAAVLGLAGLTALRRRR
ncbi:MAG: CHRD domain-containing protein [Phycisphaerales bacterium]